MYFMGLVIPSFPLKSQVFMTPTYFFNSPYDFLHDFFRGQLCDHILDLTEELTDFSLSVRSGFLIAWNALCFSLGCRH